MKKRILSFVFVFAFILTGAFCFSACGDAEPKTYNVKLNSNQGDYTYLYLGNGQGSFASAWEVEEGKDFSKYLYLDGNYNPETLKIYNGTTEVNWEREDNLYSDVVTTDRIKVGTLKFNIVQTDFNLKYEAEEKQVSFTLKCSNQESLTQKAEMLSDFKLASDTSKNLYTIISEEQTLTLPYSQVSEGIKLTCAKPIGYYTIYSGILSDGQIDESAKDSIYSYRLKYTSTLNSLNNDLNVSPENINVSQIDIITNSLGSVLTIDNKDSFSASQTKAVTLTLNSVDGVDVGNAEVYINDTKINFVSGQAYTLQLPIFYYKGDLSRISYFSALNFSIKGVEITNDSKLCKVNTGSTSGDSGMKVIATNFYFKNELTQTAYYTQTDSVQVELNNGNYDYGTPISSFTVFDGTNNYVIDLTRVVSAGAQLSTSEDLIEQLTTAYQTEYPNLPITEFRVLANNGSVSTVLLTLSFAEGGNYTISVNA